MSKWITIGNGTLVNIERVSVVNIVREYPYYLVVLQAPGDKGLVTIASIYCRESREEAERVFAEIAARLMDDSPRRIVRRAKP